MCEKDFVLKKFRVKNMVLSSGLSNCDDLLIFKFRKFKLDLNDNIVHNFELKKRRHFFFSES